MKKRFVDTNVFLRYLTADDKAKYARCKALFERVVGGKEILHTTDMVIAELVWTLLSYYKVPKEEAIEKASIILNTPNLMVKNHKVLIEALSLYSIKAIDFIDAYNAVSMKHERIEEIYSYDEDFDKIDFVKKTEP